MKTWNDYKSQVKACDKNLGNDIMAMEEQSEIISAIIKARNERGLSQRDLAAACQMPQSSIARIESLQTTPTLSTLLKLLHPLGLKLTITK